MDWKFTQCFGEKDADEEFSEADVLSAVEFDHSGDYLATGDKGGRIVIFQRTDIAKGSARNAPNTAKKRTGLEYKFHTEFQSHEAEFDYLKSLEIEEKINRISWVKPSNGALYLLSTNDKTIKLWKIFEKKLKVVSSLNLANGRIGSAPSGAPPALKIPTLVPRDSAVCATPRRVYANAHAYHINSIAVCSDGETFLSADDLRINLWSLSNNSVTFNVVDIKPASMEELTEVITSADFHPTACNLLIYSSSRGSIKLGDLRDAALCDKNCKVFEQEEDPASKTFFSEIIASVSHCKFTLDGRHIVARDYMTVKLWDIRMESEPVVVIRTHEHLRPKLCDLYENDCIFDKFEVAPSGDGRHILTGTYHNRFSIYDQDGKSDVTLELTRVRPRTLASKFRPRRDTASPVPVSDMDFTKKVLHYSWHPTAPCVAVAGLNNLYIYNA